VCLKDGDRFWFSTVSHCLSKILIHTCDMTHSNSTRLCRLEAVCVCVCVCFIWFRCIVLCDPVGRVSLNQLEGGSNEIGV